jgi:hypothetical protein
LTNVTREFFGNKLENELEVIEIGQLIRRDLGCPTSPETMAWLISGAISFMTAKTVLD